MVTSGQTHRVRIAAWASIVCFLIVGIAVVAGLAFAAPTSVFFSGEDGGEPLQSSWSGSFITEPDAGWPLLDSSPVNFVVMGSHARPVVTIHPDGSVEIAKGVSMDKATRTFWLALGDGNPLKDEVERLKRENRDLRRRLARQLTDKGKKRLGLTEHGGVLYEP